MFRVVLAIILTLFVTYFAFQNTQLVSITLAGATIADTPLYVVVIASILFGLLIGFIFYLIQAISSSFSMRGKTKELKEAQAEVTKLTKRMHELELENAKINGEEGTEDENSL